MIDGLTSNQQRTIARLHHEGVKVEHLAEKWGVTVDIINTVIEHRRQLDDKRGVIRLGYVDHL